MISKTSSEWRLEKGRVANTPTVIYLKYFNHLSRPGDLSSFSSYSRQFYNAYCKCILTVNISHQGSLASKGWPSFEGEFDFLAAPNFRWASTFAKWYTLDKIPNTPMLKWLREPLGLYNMNGIKKAKVPSFILACNVIQMWREFLCYYRLTCSCYFCEQDPCLVNSFLNP